MRRFSTAVAITDPLVKYQSLVSTGIVSPDPAQHRLARHLHKVYMRIKDYSPQVEYRQKLNQVARLTEPTPPPDESSQGILALGHHSIWRNPLFKHLLPTPEGRDSLALTRSLASHETAVEIDSPKGLFLSGEVGTGKSMLLDLLADGLPTEKKKRWHYQTFVLYAFSQLESHRRAHQNTPNGEAEYSLIWMAKKLVDESPILFLDEFQLPDRTASKLLSHLFIAFFQLGGVLIASSNRMPEELQNATGVDYTTGPSQSLMRKIFGTSVGSRGELYGQTSDFSNFLDVLKARCDFWQMEGAKDWRRSEEAESADVTASNLGREADGTMTEQTLDQDDNKPRKKPYNYFIRDEDHATWQNRLDEVVLWSGPGPIQWEPSTLIVYGRAVHTPNHRNGIVYWNFDDLVESFGPADYITMASSYHTFIIDRVPVLTILKKNEARRFITLLDALYEARCKLIIRAQTPPEDLFFPEKPGRSTKKKAGSGDGQGPDDATYSETIAEVYQDQMSPFRPNISFYDTKSATAKYDPDQDSDFGLQKRPVDFGNKSAFTGEDERFAYKRAVSRLWEMCGARWHARTGNWWQPLPIEARHWEGGSASRRPTAEEIRSTKSIGEGKGESIEVQEMAGLSKWKVEDLKTRSQNEQSS